MRREPARERSLSDDGHEGGDNRPFIFRPSSFGRPSSFAFRFGRVKVSPWMFLLGVMVHVIVPVLLLLLARDLEHRFGWALGWPIGLRLAAGGTVLLASMILEAASLPQFFRRGGTPSPFQPPQSLVVAGPYRYCRHPIYLAYVGYVLGPGIMLGLRSVFPVSAVWWLGLTIQALVEERRLRRRFGEEYESYRRATPFMIPRLWRRKR